jgi:hypothetical protein
MDFLDAVGRLGFAISQDRASRGVRIFSAQPNLYLTHWLHVYTDGSALLTWEFAITDYLQAKGIQLGSSEALNLFMFPAEDMRGPQDPAWLTGAIDQVEALLESVDFHHPE